VGLTQGPTWQNTTPQNTNLEHKMQLVRHVTPNECIVTLKNKQLQQSHCFELLPKPSVHSTGQKLTAAAEIGAGQSGLNWPCFDQMMEVSQAPPSF